MHGVLHQSKTEGGGCARRAHTEGELCCFVLEAFGAQMRQPFNVLEAMDEALFARKALSCWRRKTMSSLAKKVKPIRMMSTRFVSTAMAGRRRQWIRGMICQSLSIRGSRGAWRARPDLNRAVQRFDGPVG